MRKVFVVCLALCLVLALAACGGGASGSQPEIEPPASESAVASAPEESPSGQVSGVVIDATMNAISVQADDGVTYRFATEGAIVPDEGIALNDEVTVYYEGVLDAGLGENVQAVSVGTVELNRAAAAAAPRPQSPPATQNPPSDYISGTVVDASMNTLTIESVYGVRYLFGTEDVDSIEGPASGLANGMVVAVHYTGALSADTADMQPVQVTSIVAIGGAQSMGGNTVASTPAGDVKVMEGTVDAVMGDGTFYLVDATGVDYLLSTAGSVVHSGSGGLVEGDSVTVYYIGEVVGSPDLQDVTVTEVQVHH